MIKNKLELFATDFGSHMWNMQKPGSDYDIAKIYVMDSREMFLGNIPKGKNIIKMNDNQDIAFRELGAFIKLLIDNNINAIWEVMSPLVINQYKDALKELKIILEDNISRNIYKSLEGMARHNIDHIRKLASTDSTKYYKKLNIVARSLKFGISILSNRKFIFAKTDVKSLVEVLAIKKELTEAYQASTLPEESDPDQFHDYLIKWRLHKIKLDTDYL